MKSMEDRIKAALLAYAAGDAAGVPWEGLPAEKVDVARIAATPNDVAGYQYGDEAELNVIASGIAGLHNQKEVA